MEGLAAAGGATAGTDSVGFEPIGFGVCFGCCCCCDCCGCAGGGACFLLFSPETAPAHPPDGVLLAPFVSIFVGCEVAVVVVECVGASPFVSSPEDVFGRTV